MNNMSKHHTSEDNSKISKFKIKLALFAVYDDENIYLSVVRDVS